MSTELSASERAVLHAVCDTFFPSIEAPDDPPGFWRRKA